MKLFIDIMLQKFVFSSNLFHFLKAYLLIIGNNKSCDCLLLLLNILYMVNINLFTDNPKDILYIRHRIIKVNEAHWINMVGPIKDRVV